MKYICYVLNNICVEVMNFVKITYIITVSIKYASFMLSSYRVGHVCTLKTAYRHDA